MLRRAHLMRSQVVKHGESQSLSTRADAGSSDACYEFGNDGKSSPEQQTVGKLGGNHGTPPAKAVLDVQYATRPQSNRIACEPRTSDWGRPLPIVDQLNLFEFAISIFTTQ